MPENEEEALFDIAEDTRSIREKMEANFIINDFEGPLDLLLHLIKTSKMDIYDIKIEEITSQYLDFINRMNPCKGMLKPINIEKYKDTYKIIYKCEKCHKEHKNIMAIDDNYDVILEITKNQ